jgi:hypothetical protein
VVFYSFTVLHPRSRVFFKNEDELEEFTATLAQGARWKVLAGLSIIAISGVALIALARPEPMTTRWLVLMTIKCVLFAIATVVFCWTSWWLWPRRIFARPEELPHIRRQFRVVAWTLLTIAAISFALGIFARAR